MLTRRRLAGFATVLLILAGMGCVVTAKTQRLEAGGFAGYDPADPPTVLRAGSTIEWRFTHRPNETFSFYTSIHNPGRWPVELAEMTLGRQYVIEKVLYSYDPTGRTGGSRGDALPWKPMTLAPHGRLSLYLTVRMPDDDTGPAVHLWDGITVRCKILGLSQIQVVPMHFVLGVEKK